MAKIESLPKRCTRPRIGVTGPDHGGWPAWFATKIAIWRAGGKAVRITPSRPCSTLQGLSGLVIGGGADVNPLLYNESLVGPQIRQQLRKEVKRRWYKKQALALIGYSPTTGFDLSLKNQFLAGYRLFMYRFHTLCDLSLLVGLWLIRHAMSLKWHAGTVAQEDRDKLEVPLLREAISQGMPVLGICRGMQLLNVCLGGTLFQEISIFYEESPVFQTLLPRKKVAIGATSRLRAIFRKESMRVNSLHYQSVKTLGDGLRVSAVEANGVVQAIEHENARFMIGVQWHPEYLPMEKAQRRLFQALVDAARRPGVAVTAPLRAHTEAQTIHKIAASQRIQGQPLGI
jgi:putative glutamine amidotransferase